MARIFIKDEKIIVDKISKQNFDEISSMLSFSWSFNEKGETLEYEGKVTVEILYKVTKFIKKQDESLEFDEQCKKILEEYVDPDTKFRMLSTQAIESKKIDNLKIEQSVLGKLEKYQMESVSHAINLNFSANFSVPGSGKTWMTYFSYEEMKKRGEVERILIIAPLSAFKPWEFEYEEIFGRPPNSYRIRPENVGRLLNEVKNKEIFLVSYQTAALQSSVISDMLEEKNFLVVCDESHYIKNPYAKRTIGVLKLGKMAKKRIILTGTPLPQGPKDLWPQFTFLFQDNEILGNYDYYIYQLKNNNFSQIKQILEPFYTRVKLDQLKLPRAITQRKKIKMSYYQQQIYDAISGTLFDDAQISWQNDAELDEWRTNITIYLLAAALDPLLLKKVKKKNIIDIKDYKKLSFPDMIQNYEKSGEVPGKIPVAVDEIKKIVETNKKVVVWCTRVKTIDRMYNELRNVGYDSITVTGRIPQDGEADPNDNREKRIEEFKTSEKNILIANPASCAESISLHKHCQNAIYLDRNFNGAHYMQSLSRIHRVKMPENINPRYMMLMSEDTIDEDVDIRLSFKHQTMLRFLDEDFTELDLDLDNDSIFGLEIEKQEDFNQIMKRLEKKKL